VEEGRGVAGKTRALLINPDIAAAKDFPAPERNGRGTINYRTNYGTHLILLGNVLPQTRPTMSRFRGILWIGLFAKHLNPRLPPALS